MSKNYKCVDHFPTWYKSIELSITEEILHKRISAIEKIIAEGSEQLWLDIVRLAHGLSVANEEHNDYIVNIFKEFDLSFPITSNENIVKVLSQISLCFLFETNSESRDIVRLAIINLNFFEQFNFSEIPFCEMACSVDLSNNHDLNFDLSETEKSLMARGEAFEADEEEEEVLDNEDSLNLINLVNYVNTENKKLKEESNVLWWLFTEYSTSNKAYFHELTLSKMAVSSALELYQITKFSGYLVSAKHLLHKSLIITNGNKVKLKELSLAEVVKDTIDSVKVEVAQFGNQNEFTPFLYALSLEKSLDDTTLWKAAFNKKFGGGAAEKKLRPEEMAFQFYTEIIFLNSLQGN